MVLMVARENLVLLAPRVSLVLLDLLEVLDWLDNVVSLVREVVPALLVLLVLVVLMVTLDLVAQLVLWVLLVPQGSQVVPDQRERLDQLEALAHLDLRELEESLDPMVVLAQLVPLATLVIMA